MTTDRSNSLRQRAARVADWLDAYGPLGLALYFIVTARWGSFVVPGPPYIGDIALGALIAERGVRIAARRSFDSGLQRPAELLVFAILGYTLLLLATGDLNEVALRDAAPYLYLALALLAARTRAISATRVASLLYWALAAHVATVVIARLFDVEYSLALDASRDAYVFLERPDIGGAITGLAAAVALGRAARGERLYLNLVLGATAWALVMTNQSRAGFLASCAVIALVAAREIRFGLIPRTRVRQLRSQFAVAAVSVLALVPAIQIAVGTDPLPVDRSIGAVRGTVDFEEPARNGASADGDQGDSSRFVGYGTLRARTNAWKRLVEWLHEDGIERTVTGVGFGPHYWQISEADHEFQGTEPEESNRFAHNFLLNTWARLGLIGVILVGALVALVMIAAIRNALNDPQASEAAVTASLLAIAIVIVSSLGVVFEAPFGALPFYWSVGYLLARRAGPLSPPATPA